MEARGDREGRRGGGWLDESQHFKDSEVAWEGEGSDVGEASILGVLVTDMSVHKVDESGVLGSEFKPKWLAQSPTAPGRARRCRTCALAALRAAHQTQPQPHQKERGWCPLLLVEGTEVDAKGVARCISRERKGREEGEWEEEGVDETMVERLAVFLHRNPLLLKLRELQLQWDGQGVLSTLR